MVKTSSNIEKNLCITLVIYQESLRDARSTESKIIRVINSSKTT